MPDHAPLDPRTLPASIAPAPHAGGDVAPVLNGLERLRTAAWTLLVLGAAAGIVGVAAAVLTTAAVADFYLRTPASLRMVLLVLGLAGLWTLLRRRLGPAVRFRPSLTEIALRVERTEAAQAAGLTGRLASSLELASGGHGAVDRERSARLVHEALDRFRRSPDAARILKSGRTWRALGVMLLLLLPGFVLAVWQPALAGIAARRLLTPWSDAAWPKRTQLADLTGVTVHSSRASLPVRAVVQHRLSQTPDVWVKYRTIVDGTPGPWREDLLTPQGRRVRSSQSGIEGDLFERLIEPGASMPEEAAVSKGDVELEYSFESVDDRTDPVRLRLVDPPVILTAQVEVTPPAYVEAGGPVASAAFVRGVQRIDDGSAVSQVGPVLAGSSVAVRATLNKPVDSPENPRSVFAGDMPADARVRAIDSDWLITFTTESSARLVLLPQDQYGIVSPTETVLAISVQADQPPAASVLVPAQEEGVLPTAVVPIEGEGRDDVALRYAAIEYQVVGAAAGSQGATTPPGPAVELARIAAQPAAADAVQVRVTGELRLAELGVKPGDEVVVSALAKDIYRRGDVEHDVARSAGRKLLVISEAQLIDQVRSELAAVRDAAMRLDRDQEELVRKHSQQTAGQQAAAQRSVTQRLTPPAELIERLAQRIERNGLADDAMKGMLSDAAATLRSAAEHSDRAATALDRAERAADAGQDADQENQAARDAQDQVREELASLVGMLDRGQDGWTVRREVQNLLDQQRELIDQTRQATRDTAGKTADSLTASERDRLAELAQRQQELSTRAENAISELQRRAESLQQNDPGQAQAMKDAAKEGRDQKLAATQRQAAKAIQENRSQSANELQQKAAEAMEQMLQRFDNSQQQRDEALRRVLADLRQQLEALVRQQKTEIEDLSQAGEDVARAGLDRDMIALHAATLGLFDSVSAGPAAARPVAKPIETAAQHQSSAITELRAEQPRVLVVRESETASLTSLNEAVELAQKMEQQAEQRDQDRQRAEILEAYRSALEEQSAISDQTAPLIAKTLDRRQRSTARALGEREEALKTVLAELRTKNAEIENTVVFSFAHDQLDVVLTRAAAALKGGTASRSVERDQQSAALLLKSLVQALSSGQQNDPFREGADEGGSGEGGAGGQPGANQPRLIPEIAELQGLKGLQEIANMRTRAASEAGADASEDEVREIQRFQRDIADRAKTLLEKLNNPETEDGSETSDELGDADQPGSQPQEGGGA
ncbi:MAG: hypothetical protein L6Q35_01695 [Phycisphaerales bacterium]|nr:hypothetical protein [Phycisphaerales bacterium]